MIEYTCKGQEKKGCLAHIEIVEFNLYPQYSVKSTVLPEMSLKKVRNIRENSLKALKQHLGSNEVPEVIRKYYISLPTEEAHHKYHPTKGVMGLSQRIHPELIAKVQEYVSIGTIEPVEIQRLLRHYVNNYMCTGNLPNPSDRAYYPSLKDVKNHVAREK